MIHLIKTSSGNVKIDDKLCKLLIYYFPDANEFFKVRGNGFKGSIGEYVTFQTINDVNKMIINTDAWKFEAKVEGFTMYHYYDYHETILFKKKLDKVNFDR